MRLRLLLYQLSIGLLDHHSSTNTTPLLIFSWFVCSGAVQKSCCCGVCLFSYAIEILECLLTTEAQCAAPPPGCAPALG